MTLHRGFSEVPKIYFADKPRSKRYRAGVWKKGFKFIYSKATNEVVRNWFICTREDCDARFINVKLDSGNKALKSHLRNHKTKDEQKNERMYSVFRNDLVESHKIMSRIGSRFGEQSDEILKRFFLEKEDWSPKFVQDMEMFLKQDGKSSNSYISLEHSSSFSKIFAS